MIIFHSSKRHDSSVFADREVWRATSVDRQLNPSRDHGGWASPFLVWPSKEATPNGDPT